MIPSLTQHAHVLVAAHVQAGDTVVDGTVGNGHDTTFLCSVVGPQGRVIGIDIQTTAIEFTKSVLEATQARAELVQGCHADVLSSMHEAGVKGVAAVMFNLGYLPGSDHAVVTRADTTIRALGCALEMVKVGGVVTVLSYRAHDDDEEYHAVATFMSSLDPKIYYVEEVRSCNRRQPDTAPRLFVVHKIR